MRVLIAHSFYRVSGGEDSYVRRQVDLLERDHDVRLIGPHNLDLRASPKTMARMAGSAGAIRECIETMRRFRPDVVHVHNVYPALGPAVHIAAARLRLPLVMTVHNFRLRCPNGYMFTEGQLCNRCEGGMYLHGMAHHCFPSFGQAAAYSSVLWFHRVALRLERRVDLLVAPSRFMQERLWSWGISRERTETVPNFIDMVSGASEAPGRGGIYVGRLSSEKGLAVLLDALRILEDPPFSVVGDGPLGSALRDQAARLGLENLKFLGRLAPEDVPGVLRSARFLVMPSLCDENCPLAVLEAMAHGRPILVTRRGGLPEMVENGEGLIVEPGDPDDLAERMGELFADDELCARAGAVGIRTARERFGGATHKLRLLAAYARVIDGNSHR